MEARNLPYSAGKSVTLADDFGGDIMVFHVPSSLDDAEDDWEVIRTLTLQGKPIPWGDTVEKNPRTTSNGKHSHDGYFEVPKVALGICCNHTGVVSEQQLIVRTRKAKATITPISKVVKKWQLGFNWT